MVSWKQRLYAFLLRRALGPYLTPESLEKLHACLDVSLQEGIYVLKDIGLNAEFLSARIPGVRIRSATVRRLEIQLSLQEHGSSGNTSGGTAAAPSATDEEHHNEVSEQTKDDDAADRSMNVTTPSSTSRGSSFAWRAMQFGSFADQPTVSLVVRIELEGVLISVEACNPTQNPRPPQKQSAPLTESNSKSYLSSYLEAALSSLRLSIHLKDDARCRVYSSTYRNSCPTEECWLEVRAHSASYSDAVVEKSERVAAATTTEYRTALHKVVEWTRLTVSTGTTVTTSYNTTAGKGSIGDKSEHKIALLEGTSRATLLVVEYSSNEEERPQDNNTSAVSSGAAPARTQNDIQVSLDQKLNFSLDATSLGCIQNICHSFQQQHRNGTAYHADVVEPSQTRSESTSCTAGEARLYESTACIGGNDDDDADYRTIDGIMKQYQEARLLAERNFFRGGMLVPTDEFDRENPEEVTFDTFFDANEHSFSRYSTVLKESIVGGGEGVSSILGLPADWVHTKLRFDLREGGIKLTFRPDAQNQNTRCDEYALLTFSEVSLSSTLTAKSAEHSFSISEMELEDAVLVLTDRDGPDGGPFRSIEIGSLMRFVPKDTGDEGSDCDLLVQAPCLSLHVKTESAKTEDGEEEKDTTNLELLLESIDCSYRQRTINRLSQFLIHTSLDATQPAVESHVASETQKRSRPVSLTVYASCPSIDISLPLPAEKDSWSQLYERCGYTTDCGVSRKCALGVRFDQVEVEMQKESIEVPKNDASFSCNNIVAYACSPKGKSIFWRKVQRLDIFALSGRTEVVPCIPITVKLSQCTEPSSKSAIRSFPRAPTISSFKTRQHDEEDDDRIDHVLSSKHQGLDVSSRKELRGVDPQSTMLADVAKSEYVVSIHIPEVVGDLSVAELKVLVSMIDSVASESKQQIVSPSDCLQPLQDTGRTSNCIAVSLVLDFFSLAVHSDREMEAQSKSPSSFSFMTRLEFLKAHVLTDGPILRHARIMTQELDFFEILNLSKILVFEDVPCFMEPRINFLRERAMCHEDSVATPIIHRSHLFSPISRSSPAILIDLLNVNTEDDHLLQRNIYFILYDLTYRFDYDSEWMKRMASMFEREKREEGKENGTERKKSGTTEECHLLSRAFVSIADCNLDYASSQRFKTASRTILRVGDFRASSNIMVPHSAFQAYSISLGDISVHLCNNRYPYNFENRLLLRADTILQPHQYHLSVFQNAEPEAVQQSMNFRTVVTVDSVDAIVAVSNRNVRKPSDPALCATFTVGQVSLLVCKDSFRIFSQTIGEAVAEATALDNDALDALRSKSSESEKPEGVLRDHDVDRKHADPLKDLQQQSIIRPAFGTSQTNDMHLDFLLDGYDWTTIDSDQLQGTNIPVGEEYTASWYTGEDVSNSQTDSPTKAAKDVPSIISDHFRYRPVSDPLGEGDMGISKLIGRDTEFQIQNRVLVHDLSLRIRLFDGYDWPEQLSSKERESSNMGDFVIPAVLSKETDEVVEKGDDSATVFATSNDNVVDVKSKLMGDLLSGGIEHDSTFRDIPLPEERGQSLKDQADFLRLARRTGKCFQITLNGVSVRLDSLGESKEHRLASCLSLKARDFVVAETISSNRPVKMVGEWFNEDEHPRDSKDGLVMMKMITRYPPCRVTSKNEIVNDDGEVLLQVLPLRCFIDQRAVAFARAFFYSGEKASEGHQLPPGLHSIPPPLFSKFRVRPLKLKVDYKPQKLDSRALRDGAVVELVNLSPIDGMVLTLREVEVENEEGFGNAMAIVVGGWVRYICSSQLYKFVTNMRPFEPITGVSGTAVDMVVLPWEAFQNGESIQKALRSGARNFSKAVAYEFLTITSRAAEFFAGNISRASSSQQLPGMTASAGDLLPSRPLTVPRGLTDAGPHAMESLSRGFQAANYKVVIVPFLEYQRTGATGAVKKVLRGIPIAIAAPASGAAEALSFALLGARNSLRPDIRKEEEACLRGLLLDDI